MSNLDTKRMTLIHQEQCSIDTEGFILNDINVGAEHAHKDVLAHVQSLDGQLLKKEAMAVDDEGFLTWDILIQSKHQQVKILVYA